ncbi:sensor histidine kinase [Dysgonomonas sp. 25]|uniref:sensor histidine kinase n=1 Tax=Dysgonomonas sp. 25 TaxID=2302933 RepID=UPI0013D2A0A5|nr:histidine kinase [Dysgonomonas sp. 25]NDV68526.1 histidine kinase [Dysgonomonas sp. 25]
MKEILNDKIVLRFFVSKDFRILRHLFLLITIGVISLSFVWGIEDLHVPSIYKAYGWLIYFGTLAATIYANIYFSVPRFLLRNKIPQYSLSIVLSILMAMLSILVVQYALLDMEPIQDRSLPLLPGRIALNTIAVSFLFSFFFMGTTTLFLLKRKMTADMKKSELESSLLESELKLLQNQVNPHFLFNMLNNANMLLKKNPKQASEVLFKLEDLLRYQIHDNINKDKVSLASEISFLNDYLNLEKIRRDDLDYTISADESCHQLTISPLLFIVFVENAVKHNVDNENRSYVNLSFKVRKDRLEFICENSKSEYAAPPQKAGGLGLKNVRRRLELLYPNNHTLDIKKEKLKYTVKLTISL